MTPFVPTEREVYFLRLGPEQAVRILVAGEIDDEVLEVLQEYLALRQRRAAREAALRPLPTPTEEG